MKKSCTIYRGLVTGLMLGACTPWAVAQLVISVDMDTIAPGVQSVRTASPGDSFTVGLVFDLSGTPDGLSSYGVSVQFNNIELNLDGSPAATEALPAGFDGNITAGVSGEANSIGGGLGQVSTFESIAFGLGPTTGTFSAGTIAYKVLSPISAAGIDITPGLFNAGVDGLFDNGSLAIASITFNGGMVVPEPSIYAIATGGLLLGWAMLRRRL